MTEQELQAIKERLAKATPAPWDFDFGQKERGDRRPAVIDHFDNEHKGWFIHGDIASMEDAEFIAHARQDVPALIAEIERISRNQLYVLDENRKLREALKFYADETKYERVELTCGDKEVFIERDCGEVARKALEVQE